MVEGRHRLESIDFLRGIAVALVLLCHMPFTLELAIHDAVQDAFPSVVRQIFEHGRIGVHLFFVISGFCIHYSFEKSEKPFNAKLFVLNRLRRIYPAYGVVVVLSVLFTWGYYLHSLSTLHAGGTSTLGEPSVTKWGIEILILVLLLQNVWLAGDVFKNAALWTLAVEAQLYLLYIPFRFLLRHLGWRGTWLVVVCVALIVRGIGLWTEDETFLRLGLARWPEWVMGAFAAEAFLGRVSIPAFFQKPQWALAFLALGVFVWEKFHAVGPHSLWGLYSDGLLGLACMVATLFVLEKRAKNDFFVWLGHISYSVYLTHMLSMGAAKQVGLRLGLGIVGTSMFRLLIAVVAGWVFYQWVEQRIQRLQSEKLQG